MLESKEKNEEENKKEPQGVHEDFSEKITKETSKIKKEVQETITVEESEVEVIPELPSDIQDYISKACRVVLSRIQERTEKILDNTLVNNKGIATNNEKMLTTDDKKILNDKLKFIDAIFTKFVDSINREIKYFSPEVQSYFEGRKGRYIIYLQDLIKTFNNHGEMEDIIKIYRKFRGVDDEEKIDNHMGKKEKEKKEKEASSKKKPAVPTSRRTRLTRKVARKREEKQKKKNIFTKFLDFLLKKP